MTDERLSEARKALARYEDRNSKPNPAHLADAVRGLIALVDEAPTPTDDERDILLLAQEVRSWGDSREGWNAYEVDLGMRVEKMLNALAAGFRRTEVPGPSAEDPRPGFFPNGQCRHYQMADGWAKIWCIRTEDGHTEHETAGGVRWIPESATEPQGEPSSEVPEPSAEGYAEFEDWEQEMFRHQPVLSMADGSIAGCQCLDRVFTKGEDWGTHLAIVITSRITAEPQGEPSDAQVLAALNAYYEPDGHPGRTLEDWSEGSVRAMRAALRAAGVPAQEGEPR